VGEEVLEGGDLLLHLLQRIEPLAVGLDLEAPRVEQIEHLGVGVGRQGAFHGLDREREHAKAPLACVLVDEAQFLTPTQVKQLGAVVDELNIPVLCYGLRTDFRGEMFPGSAQLLAWADNLVELKTICHCGRKAIMVVRVKADGTAEREGAQIEIGGNERYVPLCRRHFSQALAGAKIPA